MKQILDLIESLARLPSLGDGRVLEDLLGGRLVREAPAPRAQRQELLMRGMPLGEVKAVRLVVEPPQGCTAALFELWRDVDISLSDVEARLWDRPALLRRRLVELPKGRRVMAMTRVFRVSAGELWFRFERLLETATPSPASAENRSHLSIFGLSSETTVSWGGRATCRELSRRAG